MKGRVSRPVSQTSEKADKSQSMTCCLNLVHYRGGEIDILVSLGGAGGCTMTRRQVTSDSGEYQLYPEQAGDTLDTDSDSGEA